LVPRRRKNSRRCSRRGLSQYIVRPAFRHIPSKPAHIFPTAKEDWHLYTFEKPTASSDALSDSILEQENGGETSGSDETASDEGSTNGDPQQPDLPPPTAIVALPPATITPPPAAGDPPLQPTAVPPTTLAETNADDHPRSGSLPNNVRPSTAVAVHATPAAQYQDTPDPEVPGDRHVPSGGVDLATPSNLPTNARESIWMKSRKTLKYFREVYTMGGLSDLIFHWHQLEEALGFPETVSYTIIGATRTCTDAPADPP
jgi:hypothetical protein